MSAKVLIVTLFTTILSSLIFNSTAKPLQTEVSEEFRTVEANAKGDKITITFNQFQYGKKLFNQTCSECHMGGLTKTSTTVTLSAEHLASAVPKRNNIEGLVDYMKNPTTADGEIEISEIHPSQKSQDFFPKMRGLDDDDFFAIAGYILTESKRLGKRWGSSGSQYY
jgi:photosystem II cytochrome c550